MWRDPKTVTPGAEDPGSEDVWTAKEQPRRGAAWLKSGEVGTECGE